MMNQSPQGLASLGRNGDTMLMHVSPREVQGLQGLAMAQGGSLTINPDTGLPEAFNLGRVFKSFLPAVAGFMLGGPAGAAMGTSATMGGVAAGALTGAAIAGMDGENALLGALTGGLGGYGGSNIASSMGKLGATQAACNVGAQAGNVASNAASNVGMANSFGTTAGVPMGNVASNAASNIGMANQFGTTADSSKLLGSLGVKPSQVELINSGGGFQSPEMLASQRASNINTGFKQLTGQGDMPVGEAFDKYFTPVKEGGAGGSKLELASTVGMPVLQEAMRIDPATLIDTEAIRKAQENKYRDPITGRLNLSPDSGLRLAAQGGLINSYATGGTVQSGGVRDLYGTPDNQPTMSSGLGGFGLGRLNDLAGEQAMNQAKTLGYAMGGLTALKPGGYLSGGGDGMSDSIPATIGGKQPARLADGEFVVPADVVSHLGNGSSKAGSQRLYVMLDKIRHARTGNKKQGKQINPSKYMPA